MINNLHGRRERPGLSKMSHHIALGTSETWRTVSVTFGFASGDEITLAGTQYLRPISKKEMQPQLCIMLGNVPTFIQTCK